MKFVLTSRTTNFARRRRLSKEHRQKISQSLKRRNRLQYGSDFDETKLPKSAREVIKRYGKDQFYVNGLALVSKTGKMPKGFKRVPDHRITSPESWKKRRATLMKMAYEPNIRYPLYLREPQSQRRVLGIWVNTKE